MIKVTVHNTELDHIHGNAKLSGKPFSMFKQTAYFHTMDKSGTPLPFPEKGGLLVDKDNVGQGIAYAPGLYQLHPSSFYLDRNGQLAVAVKLVPLQSKTTT